MGQRERALPEHNTTLYVANLPWRVTEDDLAALFREFGPIVDVRIIQDPAPGRSKGDGFVQLSHPELAAQAAAAVHGTKLRGRSLVVNLARLKPPRH